MMLRFFRTLRQRLLAENRVSKYLLYAVGEIVLVVVGILIALQLDDLKEKRKTDEQETKLLLELVNNLESNLTVLEESNGASRRMTRSADIVLDHFENQKSSDSLREYLLSNVYLRTLDLSYATFETIKNIGFDIIKKDELRLEIIELFEISYAHRLTSMKEVNPVFFQQFLSWKLRSKNDLNDILYAIPNENDEDLIFIKNYLIAMKSWEHDGAENNNRLIQKTTNLINHIESYLAEKG